MSSIHLLVQDKDLQNRLHGLCQSLYPASAVQVPGLDELRTLVPSEDINVCILDENCFSGDKSEMASAIWQTFQGKGLSLLLITRSRETLDQAWIRDLQPDGTLDSDFKEEELKSQLGQLLLISELRAKNLSLQSQLKWRISRLNYLEQHVEKISSILRALSQCNEVIIKADNEERMVQDVCHAIATQMGYPLVWAGYAQRDQEQNVKVMASSGPQRDALRQLKVRWDESPFGQGPTAQAIKSGQRVLIRDVASDSSTRVWADILQQWGINQALSLPISYSGVGFGALTIYAHDTDFGSEAVEYLEKVAWNMGYGIWFLRHRDKRKKVEKQLQKTNELFSLAMEATQDAIWDWNIRSGDLYLSPRWYTILGYEPYEFPQTYDTFVSVVHPGDRDRVQREIDNFLRQGGNFSLEYRVVTKEGENLWVLNRGKVVEVDDQGRPLRVVGTNVDLTERKRMEEDLNRAKKEAEQANQAKDKFLENMDYELRTPLNNIMGVLQNLAESDLKPAEKEYVGMALESSRKLLSSMNKILDLSSLQKETPKLHPQPFDLEEEMNKLISFFLPTAENKDIYLRLEIHEDVPLKLVGDITVVRQIVWNLLENAVKFTHEGGVLLRISRHSPESQEQGNLVPLCFEVEDTGQGIPEEIHKDVFEPLGPEKAVYFEFIQGPGIGLSVCKQLAHALGGEVNFSSRAGEGSLFYLLVPMEPQKEEDVAPPESLEEMHPDKHKILIVEDENINLMLMKRFLEKRGFSVLTAENGQEALEVMQKNGSISLILMDIMLPKHDGFELTQMIRRGELSALKEVPVVAVTALADSDSRQKCFQAGMNAYLSKPVDNQELMGMIQRYLGS